MMHHTASQAINGIDRQLDANHAALIARQPFDETSFAEWGYAWERNPDLEAVERGLLRKRLEISRATEGRQP